MDALSEALSAVHMTSAIFLDVEFTAPWGVSVADARKVAAVLAPAAEHVVSYHLVVEGDMLVRDECGEELSLSAGDIVIMPRGNCHRLSGGAPSRFFDTSLVLGQLSGGEIVKFCFGGGGARTRVICGFFACRRQAADLFLAGLPAILRIGVRDDPAGGWIESSIRHLVSEAEIGRPGQSILLSRMAEALFIESIRRYMQSLPSEQTGWLVAARDPIVGRVLAHVHRESHRRWSVAELARAAGSSRSIVAGRFRALLGESPIAYLSRWRLGLAAQLLETTQRPVQDIAFEFGYESEASFNRAFKRQLGAPPARYRRQARGVTPSQNGVTGTAVTGT